MYVLLSILRVLIRISISLFGSEGPFQCLGVL